MRFLVDECVGPAFARWLSEQGHDVFSVYDNARGIDDDSIIEKAFKEGRILITSDKDFGDKVFHQRKPHSGVILLRMDDERPANKIKMIERLLDAYGKVVESRFVVVTEKTIRIAGE